MRYQIVYYSRDALPFQWESRFQHQYGCLRDEVEKTYDEYWKDGVFTRFSDVDLQVIEEPFAERGLAQLHKRELITDDDLARILWQEHTGCGVWLGDSLHDKQIEQTDGIPVGAVEPWHS